MSAPPSVRVFSPFQNRVIAATPQQARILRQLRHMMQSYVQAAEDRGRLQQRKWKRRDKRSLLGELELMDSTVAGMASWTTKASPAPQRDEALKQMMSYDIPALLRKLNDYPALQRYVRELDKLRRLLVQSLRQHSAAA